MYCKYCSIISYRMRTHLSRGYTFIEMMVVIFVYGLIMTAAAYLLHYVYLNAGQQPQTYMSIDSVRSVTSTFTSELRDAAYGSDGSYPLNQASTTQIIFFTPYGYGTTTARIRYYLASTTLYKGVTLPTGNPVTYNTSNEAIRPVMYNVKNGTSSIFLYYSGTFAGTTSPLTQPVNVNQVTFVQMNLYAPLNDLSKATTTIFLMTTGSAIRNLKTNLGN